MVANISQERTGLIACAPGGAVVVKSFPPGINRKASSDSPARFWSGRSRPYCAGSLPEMQSAPTRPSVATDTKSSAECGAIRPANLKLNREGRGENFRRAIENRPLWWLQSLFHIAPRRDKGARLE